MVFHLLSREFLKDSQSTFYVSSTVTIVIQHFKLNVVSKNTITRIYCDLPWRTKIIPADIADNDLSKAMTLTIFLTRSLFTSYNHFKQTKVHLKAQHLEFVKIRPENERKIKSLREIFMVIPNMNPESSEFQHKKGNFVTGSSSVSFYSKCHRIYTSVRMYKT